MGAGWPLIEIAARTSGWSTRADGFVITGVLALSAGLAVWLKVRLTGRLEVWDAVVPLLFLTVRQWTTFIGTPDVSLGAMPVLLLVLAGLALTVASTAWRIVALLVLDLACVYTGFGLFAGLVIPTLFVRELWLGHVGRVGAMSAIAISGAIGLSYFIDFDAGPATAPIAEGVSPGDYALYVSNLFVGAFGARSSWAVGAVSLLWPGVLLGPLAFALRRLGQKDAAAAPAVIWLLCGFGLLFVVANALGRIGEGVRFGLTPRYVTLLLPAMFALYLTCQVAFGGRARRLLLSVFVVVWGCGEWGAGSVADPAIEELAVAKRDWVRCYWQTRDVTRCNETGVLTLYPYPSETPRIERRLAWLESRGLSLFAHPPGARPAIENIVLLSVDTLRADHTGWHGYGRETTPALSGLARRSVVFGQAMSTSSWTLPAHGSLLTGEYPAVHGAQDDGSRLSEHIPTLAERFQRAGFRTFGVVSHIYVARPFGFARGFDLFDDTLIEEGARNPRADVVVDRFFEVLDAAPETVPFFGFVHLFDPHWDYEAPAPDGRRWLATDYAGPIDGRYETMVPYLSGSGLEATDRQALIALYDGELRWVDRQVERLLAGLEARGLTESTLFVLTSDHGEEFLDHGQLGHGRTVFQEQLHVPLLFHHPSLATEWRREPVSAVDVTPTLLDLAGLPVPADLPGHSLRNRPPADRVLFAESIRFGLDWRAARLGPVKAAELAEAGGRAFYDLAADPAERRPLRVDPTGGRLGDALSAYAAAVDTGWHWRVVADGEARLRFAARFETPGRIVKPRHYASGGLGTPEVVFDAFSLTPDGHTLSVVVEAFQHTGSIRFELEPPDAPLHLYVEDLEGGALYGADGSPLPDAITPLQRGAPRFASGFAPAGSLAPGVHGRAVPPRTAPGGVPVLSEAARHRLEALGYGED